MRAARLLLALAYITVSQGWCADQHVPTLFLSDPGAGGAAFAIRGQGIRGWVTLAGVTVRWGDAQVSAQFVDESPEARLEGLEPEAGAITVIRAGGLADHRSAFRRVAHRRLYPGIDAIYDAGHGLKSTFIVQPGADPSRIRFRFEGASAVSVDNGELVLKAGSGELREMAPDAYQMRGAQRAPVAASYRLFEDGTAGFELGDYDTGQPLVIDPVLVFSSLYGGAQFEAVTALAVDGSGNTYAAGWTESADLPMKSAYQSTYKGSVDAFVAKFDAAGALVYATYIGGTGEDRAQGIAVASDGGVIVTGFTRSVNFPYMNAYQASLRGGRDAFLLRLNAAGDGLVFSTFLGGTADDTANGVALDPAGNAYITGVTASTNFPTLYGFQESPGGRQDAFMTKFTAAGGLVYSTYFGGAGDDFGYGIAVNGDGEAYIAGATDSTNLPVANAAQPANGGGQDAFVTHFGASGKDLLFSTYLGGNGGLSGWPEKAAGIALDILGNAWVTGTTSSTNFPAPGALFPTLKGSTDAFLVRFTPAGALTYGTYIGGSGLDYANGVACDIAGNTYVAGYTSSVDFPSASPLQGAIAGGYDMFALKFDPAQNALAFSTYYGGTGTDSAAAVAAGRDGTASFAGMTQSADFPLAGSLQDTNAGAYGGALVRVRLSAGLPLAVSVSPSTGTGESQTFNFVYSDPDGAGDITWGYALIAGTSVTAGNACYVNYYGPKNQLFLLNDAGTGSYGPLTPGLAGTVENSQCILDAGGSSVIRSGTTLTVRAAITFKAAFAGSRTVRLMSIDMAGHNSGFQLLGSWQVPGGVNEAPAGVSVTPSSGSGSAQTFSFVFSDANGNLDIQWARALIGGTSIVASYVCYVNYYGPKNQLFLINDAGTGSYGPLTPGVAGTVENSQCVLDAGASSVVRSGNTLTVRAALTFKAAFGGSKIVRLSATDLGGLSSGFVSLGTWQAPGAMNTPPTATSVTPSTGSGTTQTFDFAFSDTDGNGDIQWGYALIGGASIVSSNACYINYYAPRNQLFLVNDAGTGSVGVVTPGGAGTVENSQCAINAGSSSVSRSGNTLTLRANITFKPVFAGSKVIRLLAMDLAGQSSGFQALGTWSVPRESSEPPVAVSVTPGSGSGAAQTFEFAFSDADGSADIQWANALFSGSSIVIAGSCYVMYYAPANRLYLINDAGTGSLGPLTPGAAGTVQNSQCALDGGASSVVRSGNTLTVRAAIAFKPAFAGSKIVRLYATDIANENSGFQALGTWVAPN